MLSHLSNLPKNSLIKNVVGITVLPLIVRLGCKKKKKKLHLNYKYKMDGPREHFDWTGNKNPVTFHVTCQSAQNIWLLSETILS